MSELEIEANDGSAVHADPSETSYATVAASVTRSGLWSVAGQVVGFVAALVATPFTLRLLGPARYGLWSLLQSTQSWIGLADFGMTTASTRFAGERLAQEDGSGEAVVTWTSAAITGGATFVLSAAVGIAAPFITKSLLHVHGALVGPGEIALRVVAAACVANVLAGTLNTPMIVRLRWRTMTLISVASSLAQIIGIPVALAVLGGGVIVTTVVYLIICVLNVVAIVWIAAKMQPRILRPRVSRKVGRRLLTYGAGLTVSGIALIPLNTADRFLLGHYRSTTVVAYYVVALRLGQLLTVIPMAVCQPLFPGFIKLQGSGQIGALRALYRQALQGLFLTLTPPMLLLAFIAHPFLALWAGKVYGQHSVNLFYVLVIGVWFNCASWLPAYYLSLDNTKLFAKVHVFEIAPYVIVVALLTSQLGAIGAAIAWAARATVESLVLFVLARRVGGVTTSPLSANRVRSLASPLILGGLLLLLSSATASLQARVAYAIVIAGVYAALAWRVVLTRRERDGLQAISPIRRFSGTSSPEAD